MGITLYPLGRRFPINTRTPANPAGPTEIVFVYEILQVSHKNQDNRES